MNILNFCINKPGSKNLLINFNNPWNSYKIDDFKQGRIIGVDITDSTIIGELETINGRRVTLKADAIFIAAHGIQFFITKVASIQQYILTPKS